MRCRAPFPEEFKSLYSDDLGGIVRVDVVVDMSVRNLCVKPYPGRKKGCPNFACDRHPDCPPHSLPIDHTIDLSGTCFAAYERYDLEAHEARFRANNPGKEWTKKQARNLLHWQQGCTNRAINRAQRFIDKACSWGGYSAVVVKVPEGHGVQVFETMAAAGVILERPIDRWVHKVVLIGFPIYNSQKEG